MGRRWRLVGCSLVLVLSAACSEGSPRTIGTATNSPAPSSASSPSSSPAPTAALVGSLPSGCDGAVPPAVDTVAFVASGRAWAVAPDGTGLTCLFDVDDPGSFSWGPLADRVLLGGLEVHGVGTSVSRPAASLAPTYLSWGRPTGKAVVFSDGPKLEKAIVGSDEIEDVTPLADVSYEDVVYHPSGLALAFVIEGPTGSAIWISSNTGQDPKRLVWSKEGTKFGALAFVGGNSLLYGASLENGHRMVAALDLPAGRVDQNLWEGDQDVLRIAPHVVGGSIALDVGTGCADRRALYSPLDGGAGSALLSQAAAPTSAVGWLDDERVLVAEGPCAGPLRLWVVNPTTTAAPVALVEHVDTSSVRVPDPTPPPALPELGIDSEFA